VHAPHEPSLAAELTVELESADRVDLMCAFIVWSGVRIFLDVMKQLRARGVPIRILTTTYTGITQVRALNALRDLGAEIKVSYDVGVTRLHAKAWLIRRRSGFSTAYVGSSNMTHTALHEGLEWNVRLTESSSPDLLARFDAAFETYWDDLQFEQYDPDRFNAAVKAERAGGPTAPLLFDIRPYPFQEQILERLDAERTRHGRWRNLIVAATGTGKTVLSAFDYRRLREEKGSLRLLFVAHRREILEQSLGTFRGVLHDGTFGDLYLGGGHFSNPDHIFASIQALSNRDLEQQLDPEHFDMVIVDEFHHAEAPTYRRLLAHLQPRILLGMTATPERADRQDITRWFDGRIAAELRLWDALQQGLLCPFQYFGLADGVDLSGVMWQRGVGYNQRALSNLYTGDDTRVLKIIRGLREFVADPLGMRALGFAVSVEHAEYMARRFNEAGIPAAHLSGKSTTHVRRAVLQQLRSCEINIIFSVDLFNEGLDIPEIDTVLFLRPTESATVFLQQLGRGLRRFGRKSGLTVLDFIGQQHREFRFEPRLAALTGTRGHNLIREIQDGFPSLPAGCSMQLDRVASTLIVGNIRVALASMRRTNLADELRSQGDVPLLEFLQRTGHSLEEIYRSGSGWTELRRLAGFAGPSGPEEARLQRAIGRMHHIDDPERLVFYTQLLGSSTAPHSTQLDEREKRLLTMLHFDLWDRERGFPNLDASLQRFWQHGDLREELIQLLAVLEDRSTTLPVLTGLDPAVPLWAHQRYTRNEVLAAFGDASVDRPPSSREGVKYIQPAGADVFFVTLRKVEGRFSPSTMYRDYAISPTLFHWESQSTTTANSPTGKRYIQHAELNSAICLFARETAESTPFVFLGKASYVRHERERPMQITWRLDHAVPGDFYLIARAAA
jgi:superfamily II DNA or RNA helicase/HKD family nuclease